MDRWEWLINNASLDILEFDVTVHDTFRITDRVLPLYMMSYVKEGMAEAKIGKERFRTPPGSLILIPPYVHHDHYMPEGAPRTTFLWWHFSLTIDGSVDIMRFINLPHTVQIQNSLVFENIFYQYVELYKKQGSIPTHIFRRAKGLEVMAYLFESILDAVPAQDRLMQDIPDAFFEIMLNIVEHPEKRISLNAMAEKYFMNSTYISNRFKKLFGVTPIRLQHSVLINKAKALLNAPAACVGDVAQALGFSDVSTFTRFFTDRVGCSPSAYKDRIYMVRSK